VLLEQRIADESSSASDRMGLAAVTALCSLTHCTYILHKTDTKGCKTQFFRTFRISSIFASVRVFETHVAASRSPLRKCRMHSHDDDPHYFALRLWRAMLTTETWQVSRYVALPTRIPGSSELFRQSDYRLVNGTAVLFIIRLAQLSASFRKVLLALGLEIRWG
jgi:hypothetical protein